MLVAISQFFNHTRNDGIYLKEYYEIFHTHTWTDYGLNIVPKTKPISIISHIKTLQDSCKIKNSNVDCEAIRAMIALKLGGLLSFMIGNACLLKKPSICGEKSR